MNHIGHIFSNDESYNIPYEEPRDDMQKSEQEPTFSLVFEPSETPTPSNRTVTQKPVKQSKKASTSADQKRKKAIHYLAKNISVMKKQLTQMERVMVYLIQEEKKRDAHGVKDTQPTPSPVKTKEQKHSTPPSTQKKHVSKKNETPVRTLEGVFNGQHMIGSDGAEYIIPANYASKSKLVEGDLLKLTIQANGFHKYKQIGPIERTRTRALLSFNEEEDIWQAYTKDRAYKLLKEAVSYHSGESGDEVSIIVPNDGNSDWAALESVEKNSSS